MRIWIAAGLSLVLFGCAEYQAQQAAEIASGDDAQCNSYGAKPGSDAYIQCRVSLDNHRQANRRAALGAYLEMQRQNNAQPTPVYQMPTNRQTNCTSVVNGQVINTTCN
ncbi:hypothetical protein IVA79_08130 [Bradyrhizobium sp. 138]|uniref:hypothetical protein n=1 Tax=Bradyrhizobium sp. 138 TaxID=2782615 RepID=UPI001FF93773|nr:hypothetical protein [Bradyrhizobium sp. 138]MCK1733923.1 hypothetical protein [Bradyrhizobium sp. 138]